MIDLSDIAEKLLDALEDVQAQSATQGIALGELASLLRKTDPVVIRVASRWAPGYISAVPTAEAIGVAGERLDRTSITLMHLGASTAARVWIGPSKLIAESKTHPAIPLIPGASITLETTAPVWAVAAAGAAAEIAWISLEVDQ